VDFKSYYAAIREKQQVLSRQFSDGCCLVISVNTRNNGPCEVPVDIAARLLVEGTHCLASEGETHAFRQMREVNRSDGTLKAARRLFEALVSQKGGQNGRTN
jgi:hypothetical protein